MRDYDEANQIIDKIEHDLEKIRYIWTDRYRYALGYYMSATGCDEKTVFRLRDICETQPAPPKRLDTPILQNESKSLVVSLLLAVYPMIILALIALLAKANGVHY